LREDLDEAAESFSEVIERAVCMNSQASSEYESQRAAITSIAAEIDCTPKTLHSLGLQQGGDIYQRPEPTIRARTRQALEQKVRKLCKAN
jgi:transposase